MAIKGLIYGEINLNGKKLRNAILSSFLGVIFAMVIVEYSFAQVKYPVFLIEGQLSFSGSIVKEHYQILIQQGTMGTYILTQILDYLLILSMGTFGYLTAFGVMRLQPFKSRWYPVSRFFLLMLPLAVTMDALENAVSFFMIANPVNFPDVLAYIYSSFAALKLFFFSIWFVWIILGLIHYGVRRLLKLK